jgi:hypothetical protein
VTTPPPREDGASAAERASGRGIWFGQASTPAALAAGVDTPRYLEVREHTVQLARIAGWVATSREGRPKVRVSVGDHLAYDVVADVPRPDVVRALAPQHEIRAAHGFSHYVDLPIPLTEALPMRLEFSDGHETIVGPTYHIMPEVDLQHLETYHGVPAALEELAARHLEGRGLEFGALHAPLKVDPQKATLSFCDQLSREDTLRLVPELEPLAAALVEVDVVLDLNTSELGVLSPMNFDFYVMNGVLEHLVDPLGVLERLCKVAKPRSRIFLSVPDRSCTFDTHRALTPYERLWAAYETGATEATRAQVVDALGALMSAPPADPRMLDFLVNEHRRRSVHLHVWDEQSFEDTMNRAIAEIPLPLRVLDRVGARRALGNLVYVLERTG